MSFKIQQNPSERKIPRGDPGLPVLGLRVLMPNDVAKNFNDALASFSTYEKSPEYLNRQLAIFNLARKAPSLAENEAAKTLLDIRREFVILSHDIENGDCCIVPGYAADLYDALSTNKDKLIKDNPGLEALVDQAIDNAYKAYTQLANIKIAW